MDTTRVSPKLEQAIRILTKFNVYFPVDQTQLTLIALIYSRSRDLHDSAQMTKIQTKGSTQKSTDRKRECMCHRKFHMRTLIA